MDDQKLEAFNAVTGNQSREAAEFFIEASGGSVEKAINAFLESGGAVPDGIGSAPDAAAPATSTPADKPKMTVASAKDDEEQRCVDGAVCARHTQFRDLGNVLSPHPRNVL